MYRKKQYKESMSMYRMFKIEDSFTRNMFSRSVMNNCLADETSEGVNELVKKVQNQGLFYQKYFQ